MSLTRIVKDHIARFETRDEPFPPAVLQAYLRRVVPDVGHLRVQRML